MVLPKNVVIVEDEVITQRYLQNILSHYQITVSACFDNAKDTLANIKNLPCDLLLVDINIKGSMDGIQLAEEILRMVTLPIVFISAHNDDNTLEEVLEVAPYGFIAKPFSSKDVFVMLQVAYNRYLTQLNPVAEQKKELLEIVINETYCYSKKTMELMRNGKSVKLNHKQKIFLSVLAAYPNKAVGYDFLISKIWGSGEVSDSALRTLVYSLRKLLPDLPVVSRSKVGYMLSIQ
ncbi:sensory transduction regulatory protein [hydrothermal vent metagenome]|uniref:Sensory transduction regulatory protein n=1 Tax=hydrothermal vent metagenome TaxID=652676 RepID=A0A1W1CXI6_9ZZZZ